VSGIRKTSLKVSLANTEFLLCTLLLPTHMTELPLTLTETDFFCREPALGAKGVNDSVVPQQEQDNLYKLFAEGDNFADCSARVSGC
jgi:hypothetical protein